MESWDRMEMNRIPSDDFDHFAFQNAVNSSKTVPSLLYKESIEVNVKTIHKESLNVNQYVESR